MRRVFSGLIVSILGFCLSGCASAPEETAVPVSALPPIVQPVSQVIPLGAPSGGLAAAKREAILAAIEMLSPADAVHVSISVPSGDGGASLEDDVRRLVKHAGVPGAQISAVSAQPGKGANVAVTSYVLSPEACNAWAEPAGGDFDNRPHPGFGCIVNRNLYLMIADPRDLVAGRSSEF